MSTFAKIDVKEMDLLGAIQGLLKNLLASDKINALMVPWHLPMKNNVMPTLISDLKALDMADPLAPCFPLNAAKIVSRLTKRRPGETIGVVMRPCEIRAFVELTKLKQGTRDDIVIISTDCLGAFRNIDYAAFSAEDPRASTKIFYESVLEGKSGAVNGVDLANACKVCEHPAPENADIVIQLYGIDYRQQLIVEGTTEKGQDLLTTLDFPQAEEPSGRKKAVETLIAERTAKRDEMFETTRKTTSSMEKLTQYLAACVNCYNCRVACPVCYCRECVFVTDVFDHESFQYLKWAKRKGKIKMPTDTDFFHLTRMAHIGLTCVGCGQCSNACPNDIPLMELFRATAHHAQAAFDYEAGKSLSKPIPFSVFEDKEYQEVVGITSKSEVS